LCSFSTRRILIEKIGRALLAAFERAEGYPWKTLTGKPELKLKCGLRGGEDGSGAHPLFAQQMVMNPLLRRNT
jgi:hypothetical protein